MATALNKNSFCRIRMLPSFCIKTNLHENRFFWGGGQLVSKKATHNVKFFAKNKTNLHIY